MKKQIIRLSDFFSKSSSSRDAVRNVFDLNEDLRNDLIIDFDKIEFITRSAADELLKEKLRVEMQYEISVQFISVPTAVLRMLDSVSASSKKSSLLLREMQLAPLSDLRIFLQQF